MKEGIFQTLWDLVDRVVMPREPVKVAPPPTLPPTAAPSRSAPKPRRKAVHVRVVPTVKVPDPRKKETAQEQYDRVMRLMLAKYSIKVRKWRKSSSGVAYELQYRDGTIKRLIESPYPRGPMSMAIFLHEIGHHAIGFNVYKLRCLEEYHAWAFALAAMQEHNLNITDAVRRRMHRSLHYAVGKATRRGLKTLPAELIPFLHNVPRRAA